tara:strand:+ start:11034 stop:11360 length:327 start_codon:yes stop_codon:yes gene_type:complete
MKKCAPLINKQSTNTQRQYITKHDNDYQLAKAMRNLFEVCATSKMAIDDEQISSAEIVAFVDGFTRIIQTACIASDEIWMKEVDSVFKLGARLARSIAAGEILLMEVR